MILVVGSTGYLGGEITRRLRERNLPARAFVRVSSDRAAVQNLFAAGRNLSAVAGDAELRVVICDAVAQAWLRNENAALGGQPLALIQTIAGLMHAVSYLDTRRALV